MEYWRSWSRKKRSSDKANLCKLVPASASASFRSYLSPVACLRDQPRETHENVNCVQISMQSYKCLSDMDDEVERLKDQVKTLDDQVKDLKEKLSAAHLQVNAKDDLAKQHAKVAQEAVSEALTAKAQLDSISLLKLAAEDRASHLDAALKECMKEMRSFKEQNQLSLHEAILNKNKQWDKIKNQLEAKIIKLDRQLLLTAAENRALSNVILKNNEEIYEARAKIEVLKNDIQSSKKEPYCLSYELQVEAKEHDIQNEEKAVCVKLAQVASKQYLESMKTLSKLKAECQRLHELVDLDHDLCEPQSRTTSVKHTNPYFFMCPEVSTDL